MSTDNSSNEKLPSNAYLAFLGDAVYSLMVRSRIICEEGPVGKAHNRCASYVSASAQTKAFSKIEPVLTEEEISIFKRGRNIPTKSVPKGATVGQYHTATGIEALFGYHYLKGNPKRLEELMDLIWEE